MSQTVTTRKRFNFKAGGKRQHEQHNYWDDAGDLAREVNWRLFADENTLFFVSDDWLFSRQPVLDIDPDNAAILDVNFDADVGTKISEVTVTTRSSPLDRLAGRGRDGQGHGADQRPLAAVRPPPRPADRPGHVHASPARPEVQGAGGGREDPRGRCPG